MEREEKGEGEEGKGMRMERAGQWSETRKCGEERGNQPHFRLSDASSCLEMEPSSSVSRNEKTSWDQGGGICVSQRLPRHGTGSVLRSFVSFMMCMHACTCM